MAGTTLGFAGFPRQGLDLLAELPTFDRQRFQATKARYDATVADPAKAFVAALVPTLVERVSPGVVGVPKVNGSIAPITNDRRFAPDKAPYKDHLLFRCWEGADKKLAPTLFVRLAPDGVGFASGAALPSLDRWRALVDDDTTGRALAAAIDEVVAATGAEVVGADLKRVPAPFGAEHPRADLLRHKGLQVRWVEPVPPSVTSARFVAWCARRLEMAAPLHRWLVGHLG